MEIYQREERRDKERGGSVGSVALPSANILGLYESNWIYGIYTFYSIPRHYYCEIIVRFLVGL